MKQASCKMLFLRLFFILSVSKALFPRVLAIGDGCPEGWVHVKHNCYLFVENKYVTRSGAQRHCKSVDGFLAKIDSKDQMKMLKEKLVTYNREYWWIGLTRQIGFNGTQTWTYDNGMPQDIDVDWNKEPDNVNGNENCASIDSQGKFSDMPCDAVNGIFCKIVQNGCPLGWVPKGDDTACYYPSNQTDVSKQLTWPAANAACKAMHEGAKLLDIRTTAELEYVSTMLRAQPATTLSWWTSLNLKVDRQWHWGDDTTSAITNLTPWASEPNNLANDEMCVVTYKNGKLADKNCEILANYICQKQDGRGPIGGHASRSTLDYLLFVLVIYTSQEIFRL